MGERIVADDVDRESWDGEWGALETELRRVAAVEKVRVMGEGTPVAIHVLARPEREPDDIARDIRSVVIATTPHAIDKEIVSVVQVEESTPAASPVRVELDAVVVATKQNSGWVRVRIRLPDGGIADGAAPASPTRDDRAAAAVTAVVQALDPFFAARNVRVEMDTPLFYPAGTETLVVVHGHLFEGRTAYRISGSAFVPDDSATAAARAALDALNRHVRLEDA